MYSTGLSAVFVFSISFAGVRPGEVWDTACRSAAGDRIGRTTMFVERGARWMLVLTRSQIRELVPMPDAIELMKMAFAELSAGRTVSPLRTVISLADREGDALFMPAYVPAMDALGLKTVSVFRRNPERGLPVIHAIVGLVDPETGQPLAIMDGTYLTALRTGAVSGAAVDLLARADSRVLAAIGAGAQGVTQIAAVCAVRPIERVIAVDVGRASW